MLRVALVGNLANVAYSRAKALRQYTQIEADLFVNSDEMREPTSRPPESYGWIKPISAHQIPFGRTIAKRGLRKILRTYDLIESYCCQPTFVRDLGVPYVSYATGSDLRELALENSAAGRRTRSIFEGARLIFFSLDAGHLEAIEKLHLGHAIPSRQVVDVEFFTPPASEPVLEEFTVFHPTNQLWIPRAQQRFTKRNDILFRGFARFLRNGSGRIGWLKRGPDAEATIKLIEELGISEHTTCWGATLPRNQLVEAYRQSHVVADQFQASCGLVALEAMSCGRAVLVHMYENAYEERPPVLEATTEEEVCNGLRQALSPNFRKWLGKEARRFILKYHHPKTVAQELARHYASIV